MNPSPALAPAAARRPSLFAAPGAPRPDPADARRILASLQPPRADHRRVRAEQPAHATRWPWWAGAAVLALGLLGALAGVVRGVAHGGAVVATATAPTDTFATAARATSPVASAVTPVPAPAQAARIESLPGSAAQMSRDPFREQLSPASGSASLPTPPRAGATAAATRTPSAVPVTQAVPTQTHNPAPPDSDVDLLEAVMARVSGQPSAAGKTAGKASTAAKASTKPVQSVKTGRAASKGEARAEPLSVAEQVQRCRAVGGLDGLLCRNRVCEGHWGAEAACPASQPPGPQD